MRCMIVLLLMACGEPPAEPDSCVPVEPAPPIEALDLLFVVEDSNGGLAEQEALQAELEWLVSALRAGRADGFGELTPVRSLHLGVVSTDLGTYEYRVPGCPLVEDGAVLQRSDASETCGMHRPGFLTLDAASDVSAFVDEARCAVALGDEGCGLLQPLEAMLRAVSPRGPTPYTAEGYAQPSPIGGGSFEGDAANDGFRRADAALAVVVLAGRDDCTPLDTALFDIQGPYASVGLNFLCAANNDAQAPVGRYVDGLLQMVRDPSMLSFVAIAGTPVELGVANDADALAAIRAHPDMRLRQDDEVPQFVGPACSDNGRRAHPARRIVEVARELEQWGASATVGSTCAESYRAALAGVFAPLRREEPTSRCE